MKILRIETYHSIKCVLTSQASHVGPWNLVSLSQTQFPQTQVPCPLHMSCQTTKQEKPHYLVGSGGGGVIRKRPTNFKKNMI